MKFIKKMLAFILLIIMNIVNGILKVVSFFITRMAPALSILTIWLAIYVYFKDGFAMDKIIPVLGVAFLIAAIGIIMPYFVKGTIELEKEMHDYVFDYDNCIAKYKQPKVDYTNDAAARELLLRRIQ